MSNTFRLARKSIEKDAARLRVLLDPVASGSSVSIAGAGADNRVTLWQGAASLTSSAELYFDKANNRLGVNRGSPASAIDVEGNSATEVPLRVRAVTGQTGDLFQVYDASGDPLLLITEEGHQESGATPFVDMVSGYQLSSAGSAQFMDITSRGKLIGAVFAVKEISAHSSEMLLATATTTARALTVGEGADPTDDIAIPYFTADVTAIHVGDTVNFTSDCRGGAVTGYSWDVTGDGIEDYATQNCSHTYTVAGVYSVTLTVRSAGGTLKHRFTNYVTVTETPVVIARVTDGLIHLWDMATGAGGTVYDSGPGTPLNLTVDTPSNTAWISGALRIYAAVSLLSSLAASRLTAAVQASQEITIEAWITPAAGTPAAARIVSIAGDWSNANAELIQSAFAGGLGTYYARLRSDGTDDAGQPSLDAIDDAAVAKQHVVFTCETDGTTVLYVNASPEATGALPAATDFSGWDSSYQVCLANSPAGSRGWLGDLHLVAIYSKALSAAEVLQNYNAGGGVVPPTYDAVAASFTVDDSTPNVGDTVTFTDSSTGDIDSYLWHFGDGSTSTLQNPTHQYTAAGTVTASVDVLGLDGVTSTAVLNIEVGAATPVYYVAKTGSNENAGTLAAPWLTIQYAVDQLVAGDTLLIRGGTYNETVTVSVSGTSGAPIKVANFPGETAIIDGQYSRPVAGSYVATDPVSEFSFKYAALVSVAGNYITLQGAPYGSAGGLEVTGSLGWGIRAYNVTGLTLQDVYVHDNRGCGIQIDTVTSPTIDGCRTARNMDYCRYGRSKTTLGISPPTPPGYLTWASSINVVGRSASPVIRNCRCWNNYSEGISVVGSANVTVEDNVCYDNLNTNIITDHVTSTTIQRNLIWCGSASPWTSASGKNGIVIGAQTWSPYSADPCHDVTVRNNIVVGASVSLYFMTQEPVLLYNIWVYHNTFLWPRSTANVYIATNADAMYDKATVLIKNNILVADSGAIQVPYGATRVTWDYNCWDPKPSASEAWGTNDIWDTDPELTSGEMFRTAAARVAAAITAEHFQIADGSPCLGEGANLGVAEDYWETARGATPDIGAHERT